MAALDLAGTGDTFGAARGDAVESSPSVGLAVVDIMAI
jgi:hypothetical protein